MFETRSLRGRLVLQIVTTLLVLPFVFPLIAMVEGSLAGTGWNNYVTVLSIPLLPEFFRNSAIIATGVIIIVCACSMLAAFGFSKLHIRGREIYFWTLLAALTLPEVVLLTPLFATATSMGAYDTFWSVILPLAALQIPFTVLLARNFMDGIPSELIEAARVDGASTWRTFQDVVLPLTRPIAAAIVILTLITSWNAYLLPLVFLQDPASQTVTLVPQFFIGQFNNDQTKVLAAAVVTAIPEIVAYLCLQRLFERGLAAGALK
ncbi:carbohydrate ABC transporter permease [Arthrobacter sp. MA-N2]|uniref:carbohydrate ABC transporter permease n=1 Tax=Arthrobacter sp. MA-N2 TaxID=1101188 RepID=UPI000489C6D2|nr:carbohydrate ABC transporter permease [Arthrobacter sp. MA-N2]